MNKMDDNQKCTNKSNNCDQLTIRLKCKFHFKLYHKNKKSAKRLEKVTEKRKARALEIGLCKDCVISNVIDYCRGCKTKYKRKRKQTTSRSAKGRAKKFTGKYCI